MELYTLGPDKQPDKIVENYDSLIWTERFNTIGDFQIVTGDTGFMSKYPEGTLMTLDETNQVMQVERHFIERKKNKPTQLTIKGRCWSTILERRVALNAISGAPSDQEWVMSTNTANGPSDVAFIAMYDICHNGRLDPADIFPGSQVQFVPPADYLTGPEAPWRKISVPKGNLLTAVLQLLATEARADPTTVPPTPAVVPHGIRAVRPNASGSVVTIEIYRPSDKTDTVFFDGTRDLLDDGSYLFTKEGSADVAYLIGTGIQGKMSRTAVVPTGLERRVTLIDGATSGITDDSTLKAQGEITLSQTMPIAMFDGSINPDLSPYRYGVHYNLGDLVRLAGDYGLDQTARVTEYIRSKDNTGIKSYPTLTRVI